jgi:hypothetical protein
MMLSDLEMAVDILGWPKFKIKALLTITESVWKETHSKFQKTDKWNFPIGWFQNGLD